MTHHHHHRNTPPLDMEETKEHVLAAGREVLLAAGGALRFCKAYVESSIPKESRPPLLDFFRKALAVADELSQGLSGISDFKKTAEDAIKPMFEAMGREMKEQSKKAKKCKTRPKRRSSCPKGTRK